nr:MAG TPA: hypothetical protein [Caudoviricetes sp.]
MKNLTLIVYFYFNFLIFSVSFTKIFNFSTYLKLINL